MVIRDRDTRGRMERTTTTDRGTCTIQGGGRESEERN